jgi:hypothetical protein
MSDDSLPSTVLELQAQMDAGLAGFLAEIDQLSNEQLSGPADAAGWTGADHISHLAVWARGIAALLRSEDRWAAMGVDMPNPDSDEVDYDALNATIAAQHRDKSPTEARAFLVASHQELVEAVLALPDSALQLPYDRFVAPFTANTGYEIVGYIVGNSSDHYAEHLPWIQAIIRSV